MRNQSQVETQRSSKIEMCTITYIIMKDDQIEFHEIGESRKAEHAFHSDGYKIKGKIFQK